MPRSILILGGGFAGVQAALSLARKKGLDASVRLIDPKTYFEYHAALYRFVTGKSPMETCLPYRDIFDGTDVDVVRDRVVKINLDAKKVEGVSGSHYQYDTLLLALGSETSYFGIQGIQQYSYGMKSADEALKLTMHIDAVFASAVAASSENQTPLLHLVIVGGGASGVELAAELACYTKILAGKHRLDSSFVTIDLIEAMHRLLPMLPEAASAIVERRLRFLGVNILLNRSLVREEVEDVFLKDMQMKTKTVVWTAGMRGNSLVEKTAGLVLDHKGRIEVDELLRAKGNADVYVLGDLAATKQSGMAQTALYDGAFVADVISADHRGASRPTYKPKQPVYAIPVGPRWAIVIRGPWTFTGYTGWILRRLLDLRVFMTLLPLRKAWRAFRCI